MIKRSPRVYWFKGNKRQKDVLLFDAGYELGSIYIYELKESLLGVELENQINKYGYYQAWDITPSLNAP